MSKTNTKKNENKTRLFKKFITKNHFSDDRLIINRNNPIFFSVVFYNTVFTNREVWFPIKSEILYNVTQVHYGHIVTAAVSLRFFELVFVQKFFAVAHSFLGNLTIEFIAVLVGYFFSPLVKWNLYPFGLSSISRFFLVADFFNIYIVITLLIFIVGSVILDFLMSKIGIKNLLEK